MELAEALLAAGTGRAEASFALFAQTLNPEWIDAARRATGTASVRRRKLPADYVVWLVIGMGWLRDRSIEDVVRHLNLAAVERAKDIVLGHPSLSARDALHLALMERYGVRRIMSFDRGFDDFPGVERLT